MNVQPLVEALKATVEAGGSAGVPFGRAKKPATASTRYIVGFFDGGRVEDRSLRSRDGWSTVGTFHCYATNPDGADYAYDRLTASILALHGQTVGDRVLLMPEQLASIPMDRDDKADSPLYDLISEWRFRATPA